MNIVLNRIASDSKSTLGDLLIDGAHQCFVCEDQKQPGAKVANETRIPAGKYRLRIKPIGTSRFDEGYLKKLPAGFHKGMIELSDVPGFSGILIHIGNFETDTSGCLLVGLTHAKDRNGHFCVYSSKDAYLALYPKIYNAIADGDVSITINDELD